MAKKGVAKTTSKKSASAEMETKVTAAEASAEEVKETKAEAAAAEEVKDEGLFIALILLLIS